MKGLFCSILIAGACMHTHAAPVNWELVDFRFSDGGTAYGSFTYDSETDQLSNIDIYTTKGRCWMGITFPPPVLGARGLKTAYWHSAT